MKPKHTPGPWHATEYFVRPSKSDGEMDCNRAIVKICRETKKALVEQQKANACLIAAAPEMLEVLIAMDEYTHREQKPGPMANPAGERFEREQIWKMVRTAIAKARGE